MDYSIGPGRQFYGSPEPVPEQPTPMLEEMAALDAAIEYLGKQCEILESRLQPVLLPVDSVPPNPTAAQTGRELTIPLAREMRIRRERVEMLASHITSMLSRVGV